jgi:mono/diheme cytochrome c family protein
MANRIWPHHARPLVLSLLLAMAAGPKAAGAQNPASVYAQKCAKCHGVSGDGDGPAGQIMVPPPSPFSTSLKGKSDRWIELVIKQGGPAAGLSPAMPAHPNLSDDQVKALSQYIKGLNR